MQLSYALICQGKGILVDVDWRGWRGQGQCGVICTFEGIDRLAALTGGGGERIALSKPRAQEEPDI